MRCSLLMMFLISSRLLALPFTSEITMLQIATNTLDSVRGLKQILTESREFNEQFEQVYSKVDQGIWKADRTTMWLEDMKELKEVEIENMNDFNYALSRLKDETTYLRKKLVEQYRKHQESEKRIEQSRREEKRSKSRISRYSVETKSSMSPQMAQIETAKNTKDMAIENARLNAKIDKLSIEMGKLTSLMQDRESRRLKTEIEERKKLGDVSRGVLTQRQVEVR